MVKLHNTNFINISTFDCYKEFAVILLSCNFNCESSSFLYDSGNVSLHNGYFSRFMSFASSFLVSANFMNIEIYHIEFSDTLIFKKWGISSYEFHGCKSLFCIADSFGKVVLAYSNFDNVFTENNIFDFSLKAIDIDGIASASIKNNQFRYVKSSHELIHIVANSDSTFSAHISNLNIEKSSFASNLISINGQKSDTEAIIENIYISNSSCSHIIYSNSTKFLSISFVYLKDLYISMTFNYFMGVINHYYDILWLGFDGLETSIDSLIFIYAGEFSISSISLSSESFIEKNQPFKFSFIDLQDFNDATLTNIEFTNFEVAPGNKLIQAKNGYNSKFTNIYIYNITEAKVWLNDLNWINFFNINITMAHLKGAVLDINDCWNIKIFDSYLEASPITTHSSENVDNIFITALKTIFIDSPLYFSDYSYSSWYKLINCSFLFELSSENGIISNFNGKNNWIITENCHFQKNQFYLIFLEFGNYQDINSTFEWNQNIFFSKGDKDSLYLFNGSQFYNNGPDDNIFIVETGILYLSDCIFLWNGGLYVNSSLFINNCIFVNNTVLNDASLFDFNGNKSCIANSHFSNNIGTNIISSSSIITEISNLTFYNELKTWPIDRIIKIRSNGSLSISNSNFTNYGSEILLIDFETSESDNNLTIKNTIFMVNTIWTYWSIYIYMEYGDVFISNITVVEINDWDSLYISEGSAFIYVQDVSSLIIEDSSFDMYTNSAVFARYIHSINIKRCSFKNGAGARALFIANIGEECYLSDLQFTNNTSNDIGASIYFANMSDTYTVVDRCIFENNRAYDYGGAIALDSCGVTIQNSKFINNTSAAGGAIASFCKNDNETNYLINNTFYHNIANTGGVIYWENNYYMLQVLLIIFIKVSLIIF